MKSSNIENKKSFFIKDKDVLIKIKQPDIKEVALLYTVLLEKLKKSNVYHKKI